ncbi:type III export protein PscH [Pseudomonas aeruginosa]|nr:type III export protein PscH [Pseudomonas aeruginosa]
MSRIDTPPGFAVYPSASPKAANLPAVDQVLAFEQALGGEPPAAGRRLAGLENGALGERLLQRFAQPLQGLEADRLELKAMLRAELPLGASSKPFSSSCSVQSSMRRAANTWRNWRVANCRC